MRHRPSSRLIVLAPDDRALLFRFDTRPEHPDAPAFWATPGGALEPGETFAAAARRELAEETGIVADPGAEVARRRSVFTTLLGETVDADERYFLVRTSSTRVDDRGHSPPERAVMRIWRWWAVAELRTTAEKVFPTDFAAIVEGLLGPAGRRRL